MADHKATSEGNLALPTALYDFAKWATLVGLPAASAAYFALAPIWNLPAAEQVVGTLAVITTFLGVVLGISKVSYDRSDKGTDGGLNIDPYDEDNIVKGLDLSQLSNSDIASKGTVTLKVNDVSGSQD